jgi:3-hydroxyisobutyrate dehydrogenase
MAKVTVGFIGTGIMGGPMAGHLQAAGYPLRVFNRTRPKAQALLDKGATWCDSPAAAARGADVVFTMVGFPSDVESVILGKDGVLPALRPGAIVVDMTTSEPALARRIYDAARAQGVGSLDAPVTGGDMGARNATLSIMVGGEAAHFELVRPLLEAMGKTIRHVGPAGSGQHAKMVNQILLGGLMTSMAEAFTYARKAGLDLRAVLDLVGSGALGSPVLNRLGACVIEGNWQPGFIIEHYIKDMDIALREAAAMGVQMPTLALARADYQKVADAGHGREGTQAIVKVVGQENGVKF